MNMKNPKDMTRREFEAYRQELVSVSNILEEDFTVMWDWVQDYTLETWKTKEYPRYLAEHFAKHMIRKFCIENNLNFRKEFSKVSDMIFNKKHIDYDKLIKKDCIELLKERWINYKDENWKELLVKEMRDLLKDTH